jgi:hypothetical protein
MNPIPLNPFTLPGPIHTGLVCLYKIKKICSKILAEKNQERSITSLDIGTKKDIISLLIKARKAGAQQQESSRIMSYQISDKDISDQIVLCDLFSQELLLRRWFS